MQEDFQHQNGFQFFISYLPVQGITQKPGKKSHKHDMEEKSQLYLSLCHIKQRKKQGI